MPFPVILDLLRLSTAPFNASNRWLMIRAIAHLTPTLRRQQAELSTPRLAAPVHTAKTARHRGIYPFGSVSDDNGHIRRGARIDVNPHAASLASATLNPVPWLCDGSHRAPTLDSPLHARVSFRRRHPFLTCSLQLGLIPNTLVNPYTSPI